MLTTQEIDELKTFSKNVRYNILKMINSAKSGHPGGSLSGVDILSVLYNRSLNIPIEWQNDKAYNNRDRFILSKGHASPLLYSVLAQRGFFPKDMLLTFRKSGSKLQGHPSLIYNVPGVEASTGSLGQGLSLACGIAIGLKLDKNNANVVVYMGDGELQEGSCWEGFMQAAHRNLNNLIVIIDRNRLQIDGSTENVMALGDVAEKIKSFGWNVEEIDGHNYQEIYNAIENGKSSDRPFAIVANTIKGKGVSFMENKAEWHGKAPDNEQFELAVKELE